jgi:hypothetical protein
VDAGGEGALEAGEGVVAGAGVVEAGGGGNRMDLLRRTILGRCEPVVEGDAILVMMFLLMKSCVGMILKL